MIRDRSMDTVLTESSIGLLLFTCPCEGRSIHILRRALYACMQTARGTGRRVADDCALPATSEKPNSSVAEALDAFRTMYLSPERHDQILDAIRRRTVATQQPVLILAATGDADAVCACRILLVREISAIHAYCIKAMLREEFIPYKVVPVTGYSDISSEQDGSILTRHADVGFDGFPSNSTLTRSRLLSC